MHADAGGAIGARRKGGIRQGGIDAAGAAPELNSSSAAISVHKATNAAILRQQRQRQRAAVDIVNREIHQGATDTGVHGGINTRHTTNRWCIIHRVHVHRHCDRCGGFSIAVIQRRNREGTDSVAIGISRAPPVGIQHRRDPIIAAS